MKNKIVIIGAGPTGLGAAYRLRELGARDWKIYEKNSHIGGLSASCRDSKGFTWDIGGHVLFSGIERFNSIFEKLMQKEYLSHERKAYIRAFDRWIPYPFQNNIRYLSREQLLECIVGLIETQKKQRASNNFYEWIINTFGKGVANYFMLPHNRKVWAHPLRIMDKNWIAERVSVIDISRILENVIYERDDLSWGPNNKFKFPLYGGTQDIFRRVEVLIEDSLSLEHELKEINIKAKELLFKNGVRKKYDFLINTAPLDKLIHMISPHNAVLRKKCRQLRRCGVFVVGIGIKGKCPEDKCWVYSPEDKAPFFRATYFSNYSPNNVPENGRRHWSFICEITYSRHKPVRRSEIIARTIQGLENIGMLQKRDRNNIVSTFLIEADFAYPIPTLGRDVVIREIQGYLEKNEIFSRGRFGGWKYEIGNMDHSFIQGIEIVERLLLEKKETIWQS